jgi:hypothetical protein
MSVVEVTAQLGKEENSPAATVSYDFGDNLDEAVELFGEEVVFMRFKSAATIDLQALIRRHLGAKDKEGKPTPKSEEDIQKLAAEWTPGVQTRKRKTDKQKAEELLSKLPAAQLAELLASLQNGAAA